MLKRGLSILLTVFLLLQILPLNALAAGTASPSNLQQIQQQLTLQNSNQELIRSISEKINTNTTGENNPLLTAALSSTDQEKAGKTEYSIQSTKEITEVLQPPKKTISYQNNPVPVANILSYLPTQVAVKLDDGSQSLLDVEWNMDDLVFELDWSTWENKATISGSLVLPNGITNPDNLQVSLTLVQDTIYSTPNGYADTDFQSLYLFMSRFLSGDTDGSGLPVYLPPEQWSVVTWVTKDVQGIPTKFVQSINLDNLTSKTESPQLDNLVGLDELTTLSCKNSGMTFLHIYYCPKLTTIDCSNNQLFGINLGDCPSLTLFNCANNTLSLKSLPAKADLPTGCTYSYAPQNPRQDEEPQEPDYYQRLNGLAEDFGEGYFLTTYTYVSDDDPYPYGAPYVTTWVDQDGAIVPHQLVTGDFEENYYDYAFVSAQAASGKTLHRVINNSDFPGLSEITAEITLPIYGLLIRSLTLTPQGGGAVGTFIDDYNHRITITPEGVSDFTHIDYTLVLPSGSTASLPLTGTLDISSDIPLTIYDSEGHQQQWTIGREINAETRILSFTLAEDPDAVVEIHSDISAIYVGLSAQTIPLTSLTPTIVTSAGGTVVPASGVAQNFSQPLSYTVTSENGSDARTWKVYVVYKDGDCTCTDSKLTFPDKNVVMEPLWPGETYGGGAFIYLVNMLRGTNFTDGLSLERYPCFQPGHAEQQPTYTYRIGSTNEAGALWTRTFTSPSFPAVSFLNPGKFSLIATATLNGKTIEKESQFEILPYADNFKLLTTSLDVNVGDNVTVKWNDDSLSTHPGNSYTLYYSEDIRPGSWKEEVCTVTGVSEATFTWEHYQHGYIHVQKNLPDGSYLICSAPVQAANMKLSVDLTLPKMADGDTGCFDNRDYVIDYKITGQDLAKYKDQIKLYTEIVYYDYGGPAGSIPFTDYEVTDSQIILHHQSYPEIDLSHGNPPFYLKATVSNMDGSFVHDELANYQYFHIYKLPSWAINAAVYDYKNQKLDAEHPLLLGPGFLDLNALTIADVLKEGDNPILYTCDFEVRDSTDNSKLGSGMEYTISDESVAEFEYQTNYAMDGTPIKFPRAIIAKKDGECTVTIKYSYTGLVLSFPVKVSLAKDTLVWFKVINGDKYGYPVSNFIDYIGADGIIPNPTVSYMTKKGAKKTVTGDAQGNVLIYDPDGLTGEVEVKAPFPGNPLKYYWYSVKLEMDTLFKSTAWGSTDWLIRDGAAPRYQMLPAHLVDVYSDPTMNFMLNPNEDLMKFSGFAQSGRFSTAALAHMQAKVYVLNAAGEEVFSAPTSIYSSFLQVAWNDAAKAAMLDDNSKVLVEIVPLTEEPATLTYSIVGTDRPLGVKPVIGSDGKTMTFTPNAYDSYQQFVHITVRATNNQTGKTFDFVVEVSVFYQFVPPANYAYPYVTLGGTYTLNLDTIFTKPVIQSTLFERTAAELRQSSQRFNGNVNVDVPVNVGRKNGVENTVASVLLVDQNGSTQEASSRTTPLGITPDKPITMVSYLKSTAEDALSGNDYTIEAYKNNDLLQQEWQKSYYLGSGDTQMKYKWYINAIKLDANLVPPTDYFKPKFQILKDDGSTETVTAKFEAVNPDGLVPDPKPPANLPFTGQLSSGAFNTGVMGQGSLPFELPGNLNVEVQYDFSQGNLEGTFKMLVGYGGESGRSQSGDRFASDYSEAVSAVGNIRHGGVSKGGKGSFDFTVAGYVNGIVRYVDGNYKMIATGGGIIASAGFEYSWCQNAVVGFIPVYYGIDIGARLSVDASINAYNFDDVQAINGDYEIAYRAIVEIAGYVKISGGIGFDVGIAAAKIGAFGQLDISYKIGILYASGDTSTGGKFTFKGTIGIEAIVKFLWWKKRYVFCDAGFTYTYTHGDQTVFDDDDDGDGFAASKMRIMSILPMSDYNPNGKATGRYVLLDTGYEMEDRDYLANPQLWNGDQNLRGMMKAVDLGTTTKSLLTNAYPYAYPILSRDGRTLLMLSDMGSTDINDTSTVYSQKGSDGLWSVQQKIDPSETTAASNLSYDGNSSFSLAAWENVQVDTTDDLSQMADKSEIKAAVYNGSSWTTSVITNNSIPDMGPIVAVNGQRGALLWQRTTKSYGESDPLSGQAPAELWLKTYANSSWSNEIKLAIPALQVIKSYKATVMIDGTVMVVYSYEKSGSVGGDIGGREIGRLIITPSGTVSNVMNCTSDSDSDTNPQVMAKKLTIGGVEKEYFYVAWYNQQASVDSQGNTVIKKDILIRTYNANNEEVQILPTALNANRVSDDPELTENFSFIRSESANPQDFGISWLLPYSQDETAEGETASEYGVYTKLFANNGSKLMLTAPIKAALVNAQDTISAFSTLVTRSSEDETLNVVYAKARYSTDEEAATPEDIFTPGQTDLYWASTLIKNTISVDEVDFDRKGVFTNTPTNISFTVANRGIKEIKSLKLSTGSQNFTVPIQILPNSSQQISVLYLNGAVIESPVFSITPVYTDGSEGESTTATVNLAVCDLEIVSIAQSNAGANGDFSFDITVRNNSQYPMAANNIMLDLGIYEDVSRTVRASVHSKFSDTAIQNISTENLDNSGAVYRLSYHVDPVNYDKNGLKLLYVTLNAKDADGQVLQELSYENNTGIIEFTDPNLLYKEQFNLQLSVAKDQEGKGAVVTSVIENLHTADTTNRILLRSTDEQGNLTEMQAILFTLSGGDTSDLLQSTFGYFGKRVDYKFMAQETLGFTFTKQDATVALPGKITVAGFGGSGVYEYSSDNGLTWQNGNVFDGLTEAAYSVCVRDKNNPSIVSLVESIVVNLEISAFQFTATPVLQIGINPSDSDSVGIFIGLDNILDSSGNSINNANVAEYQIEINYETAKVTIPDVVNETRLGQFDKTINSTGKVSVTFTLGTGVASFNKLLFLPIVLTGSALETTKIQVKYISVSDANHNQIIVENPSDLIFQRGKILNEGLGTQPNTKDALAGLQYLAGLKNVGTDSGQVTLINMASIIGAESESTIVRTNVKDVIALMQYLVGLRNDSFQSLPPIKPSN